jgi:hypothetical protein
MWISIGEEVPSPRPRHEASILVRALSFLSSGKTTLFEQRTRLFVLGTRKAQEWKVTL